MEHISIYINLLYIEISSNTTYAKGAVWEARQGSGHLFRYSEYGNKIPKILNIDTNM